MSDLASNDAWTVQKAVLWATDDFRKKGIPTPRLEAELLLSYVLGLDRVQLIVQSQKPLADAELMRFRQAIVRRRSGEPLAYIVGHREFYGRRFSVDRRVLIPRPDTEILVETALSLTKHRALFGRALDVCTGSGIVAISFAKARPTWQVTATDLSEEALSVARKNALAHGALWGMRFLPGDLFSPLAQGERFEIILSNPPYIPDGEIAALDAHVRDFEPTMALAGGTDGLRFYPVLAENARRLLIPGGVLAVEVGVGQAAQVEEIFLRCGLIEAERFVDYGGHERVVCARAPRPDTR